MAKLTKAQQVFIGNLNKWRGGVYFRRDIKTEKEQCFIGSHRVSSRIFFFFFDMGYLDLQSKSEGKKYEYFGNDIFGCTKFLNYL
jgi:hypothetical protein